MFFFVTKKLLHFYNLPKCSLVWDDFCVDFMSLINLSFAHLLLIKHWGDHLYPSRTKYWKWYFDTKTEIYVGPTRKNTFHGKISLLKKVCFVSAEQPGWRNRDCDWFNAQTWLCMMSSRTCLALKSILRASDEMQDKVRNMLMESGFTVVVFFIWSCLAV